jgi:3-hydroxyacyl-[acyl-carrier-protein] dehydratase
MRWLLIDKILECEPGVSAVGVKTFPRSDEIFMDHFPGFPIVPGVLQIEMIAQMAGKCAAMATPRILPVLGNVKGAKFYRNINPGDRCVIKARVTKITKSYVLGEGEVEVDGQKCSWASILFGVVDRAKVNSNNFDAVTQEFLARQTEVASVSSMGESGIEA